MTKILSKSVFPLLIVALIAVLYVFLPTFTTGQSTTPDTMFSGHAWSSNIGWISLNCDQSSHGGTNDCATSNYGVFMDSATGVFSGYAWSSNIGWINFAPAGPYPQAPNNGVKLVAAPGNCSGVTPRELSGWARVYPPAGGFVSGWDGWIKFSGSTTGGNHYGVCLTSDGKALGGRNGTTDYGWAWGGGNGSASDPQLVGWVQFDPTQTFVLKGSPIREIPPQ